MESTISDRIKADRRGVLSSLWIFVFFNMLFRDIHEFARPGWIEELMSMEVAEGLPARIRYRAEPDALDDRVEPSDVFQGSPLGQS